MAVMNMQNNTEKEKEANFIPNTDIKIISKHDYRILLNKYLPQSSFKNDPLHLIHYFISMAYFLSGMYVILTTNSTPLKIIISITMGIALASLTFVLHDLMHGSIVKSKKLTYLIGMSIGFFNLFPPLFWQRVHNLHHARTGAYDDPDRCYVKEETPKTFIGKFMYKFRVSNESVFPLLSLILISTGFFWYFMGTMSGTYNKDFSSPERKKYKMIAGLFKGPILSIIFLELALILTFQTYLFFALAQGNLLNFFFISILPVGFAHALAMGYIHTNHFLSPLTGNIDDPLLNSLSLKDFWISDKIFSNFSYHVEHHLFPAMPSSQYPKVRALLQKFYPERYQLIPTISAIKQLFSTPRIYNDYTHLISLDGEIRNCLLPKTVS